MKFLSTVLLIFIFLSPVITFAGEENTDSKGLNKSLINACTECDLELVISLIKAGANVNYQNEAGDTAMHQCAAYCFNLYPGGRIMKALLNAGGNIYLQNKSEKTALQTAINWENSEVVNIMLKHKNSVK